MDDNPGAVLEPLDFKPRCNWYRTPGDPNSKCENDAEWFSRCADKECATVFIACVGHKAQIMSLPVGNLIFFGCHDFFQYRMKFHQLQGGVVV